MTVPLVDLRSVAVHDDAFGLGQNLLVEVGARPAVRRARQAGLHNPGREAAARQGLTPE